MSSLKNKVEHRLMRVLSDFKTLEASASYAGDKAALAEVSKRQAELLMWAMENIPDRSKRRATDDVDTF